MSENEKGMLADIEKTAKRFEVYAEQCMAALDNSTSVFERRAYLAEASSYRRCAKDMYALAEAWRKRL